MILDALSRGYLDGLKVGTAFGKYHHQVGIFSLIGNAFGSYKLFYQAHSLGFVEKFPRLIKPIKWGLITITGLNLATVVWNKLCLLEPNRSDKDRYLTTSPVWNLTPKINTIGIIAATILEHKKQPERTLTFCASGAVVLALTAINFDTYLPRYPAWAARSYLFITGDWSDRGGITFKAVKSVLRWLGK